MALNLVYPLKKGTYRRVRGYASHEKWNPGTWYGIDDGCIKGTPIYAVESGKVSHSVKQTTGGGWNFRLNLTKYPGWFYWYAHCSSIPRNYRASKKTFKKGQIIARSGTSGGDSGYVAPHLHHSLLNKRVPKNVENKNVVKWVQVDPMADKVETFKNDYATLYAKFPSPALINTFRKKGKDKPNRYVMDNFLTKDFVKKAQYNKDIKDLSTKVTKLEKEIKELDKVEANLVKENIRVNKELTKCAKRLREATEKPTDGNSGGLIKVFVNFIKAFFRWLLSFPKGGGK